MEELREADLLQRYPEPGEKTKEEFRNYEDPARDTVKEFYRLNHRYQSFDFVQQKEGIYFTTQVENNLARGRRIPSMHNTGRKLIITS